MSALLRPVPNPEPPTPSPDRETARRALHVYVSRTGISLAQIAEFMGFARSSLHQFASRAKYSDGDGSTAARRVMEFIAAHPPEELAAPGKLYETECTRNIRAMVSHVASGRNGILYGPAGSQKSFTLQAVASEDAGDPEPRAVYVECSPRLTPTALLRRICAALAAPYAQYREGTLQSLLVVIRARRRPLALLIDEAQHLYRAVDTLETIRDVADKARGRVGIMVAGNEDVLRLFEPRRGVYFEQWRSRIEQKTVKVPGLTGPECREIIQAELGTIKAETVEIMLGKPVIDPDNKHHYYSARRLFNAIRDFREMRERAKGGVQ